MAHTANTSTPIIGHQADFFFAFNSGEIAADALDGDLADYLNKQTSALVTRLDQYIRDQTTRRQKAHETRVCKWGALGVGAAALVTMHTITHELLTSLHGSFQLLDSHEKHFGFISIIVSAADRLRRLGGAAKIVSGPCRQTPPRPGPLPHSRTHQ